MYNLAYSDLTIIYVTLCYYIYTLPLPPKGAQVATAKQNKTKCSETVKT